MHVEGFHATVQPIATRTRGLLWTPMELTRDRKEAMIQRAAAPEGSHAPEIPTKCRGGSRLAKDGREKVTEWTIHHTTDGGHSVDRQEFRAFLQSKQGRDMIAKAAGAVRVQPLAGRRSRTPSSVDAQGQS